MENVNNAGIPKWPLQTSLATMTGSSTTRDYLLLLLTKGGAMIATAYLHILMNKQWEGLVDRWRWFNPKTKEKQKTRTYFTMHSASKRIGSPRYYDSVRK